MVTGRREAGRRGREGSGGRRRAGRAATEQHREGVVPWSEGAALRVRAVLRPASTQNKGGFPCRAPPSRTVPRCRGAFRSTWEAPEPPRVPSPRRPAPFRGQKAERGPQRNMAVLRAFPRAGPALRSRPRPLLPPEAAQSSRPGEKYHRRSSYTGVDLIKPPPIVYFNIALVTEIIKMDSAASSLVFSPFN